MAQESLERPVESLQKCVLFLRDNIHREKLLIDHLLADSELSDEEKQGLKEGKDYICIGKELKSILRNGSEKCKELLDVFKQSSLFTEFKEQLKSETVYAEKEKLALNSIREHRDVLLEELEPSLINDILLESSVVGIEEHDEVERTGKRIEKCRVLLSLPEKHPEVLEKFGYAMQKSKCFQALNKMKDIHPKKPAKDHNKYFAERECLYSNHEFLVDEVEPVPLCNICIEENILNANELERIKSKPSRKQQAEDLFDWLTDSFGRLDQSESVLNEFGHCLEELGWDVVIKRLKGKESDFEDSIEYQNTGKEEKGFIILKPEEVGMLFVYEGRLPSNLVLTIYIPERVDLKKVVEAIKFLNRDTELRSRLTQLTHMKIDKAEGSLILHLTSLTEEAGQRFLADGGRLVKEVVTTVLDLVDFSEDLHGAKTPLDIQVKLSAAASDSSKRADIPDVHHKIQLKIQEIWDLLIDELEPCLILTCFRKKGLMTEKDESCILESNERRARVVNLLQTLLKSSNAFMLDYFVQLLKQLDKSDLAEKLESGDVDAAHQQAEMVRKCLLLHFNEALEEIDSCMIEDTLTKCGDPVPDNIRPKSGFSRRGRAYSFLIYVFGSDGLVLVLKKVLEQRGMGHFFNIFHADIEESTKDKNTSTSKNELKENVFFDCKYTPSLKEGYKPPYRSDILEMCEVQYHMMHDHPRGLAYGGMQFYPRPIKVVHHRKMIERPPQRHQRQHRKDRRIPVTFQMEEKRTWQVVAAIDFGTAYSGFAFSMRDNQLDVAAGKWKTHSSDLLESPKTPTSLLLTSSNEFVAFGYEAEKRFRELVEEDKHRDFRFFNHFKMVLFRGKTLDTKVEVVDHMNCPMKALDVFSLAIKYLYDQCLETLREKSIKKEDIRWVVTVPAIWDEFAKQFMRNAAIKAGIPRNQLTLALEPEAAAIYIIKGSRTDLTSKSMNKYSRGTQILLVDLGGGIADFSLIGISGDRKLEVLHKASGGALGGNKINTKVWEILENLLGKNVIEEFKKQTSDCMEMESNIELKKRDLSSESKLQLTMFPSLSEICKNLTGKTYKDLVGESQYANLVKVRTGKIIFEHELIDKMFELTLAESFYIMDKLLKNGSNVQDIVLVGGFSDSEIIQKQFKERFSDYEVIIPADAGLAVLKGAVIFGHNENLIKSRICPFTYGIEVLRFWLASDPESSKKIINGTSYCTGIFDKLVTVGDTVEVGKTVEREFFAPSNIAKNLQLKFYRTDKRDVQSVTDEGCECIGIVKINLSGPLDGTEHAVCLSFKFGEAEITVCGFDKMTGQLINTEVDFLGKSHSAS